MRTVLVIEDDFDTVYPLAELLRLKGYTVNTATEAEQGLALARQRPPDLIITDIALPGASGLHFINKVRGDKQLSATPIIVISGCGPMIMVEAEAAGANCCLEKPISIDLFWAAIDRVLGVAVEPEAPATADSREDRGRALAGDIDGLVEALRRSTTKEEKDQVLKCLKERIRELQTRETERATDQTLARQNSTQT
ncbi:MAG TPA: response regulator [Blastocatellia bacterium]|nr:response regulator [Blastocatellia bacterium]